LGYGLAGMVVLGGWLDLMILEVFSSLNDSMILWRETERSGTLHAAHDELVVRWVVQCDML